MLFRIVIFVLFQQSLIRQYFFLLDYLHYIIIIAGDFLKNINNSNIFTQLSSYYYVFLVFKTHFQELVYESDINNRVCLYIFHQRLHPFLSL